MANTVPATRPRVPNFSSGPCAKRPGWALKNLSDAPLGRSHRAKIGKAKLQEVIERSKSVLGMPADYVLGIVPASDTGAIEMALWNLLGPELGVDVFTWESFGALWAADCQKQLQLSDLRVIRADYGLLPDLSQADWSRDTVFTFNGTTSGVRVPNLDWVASDRQGLSICDATSAVFAMEMDWTKLDVVTWSWQKVLGGEAAHGMIALSPKALARLKQHRPLPRVFQLTKGVFEGDTINTPSMLCVEDALDGLKWAEAIGGLPALVARSQANLNAIAQWVERTEWASFLAKDPATRSSTSICLLADRAKAIAALLEQEGVAYDIGSYRDAPAGLRIWGGATVETSDIEALLPWLDWAYTKAQG